MTAPRSFAGNILLNFMGEAAPLLVLWIVTPLVMSGLGTSRYGVLSLTWVIINYLVLLDWGLSRAVTRLVSQAIHGKQNQAAPSIVFSAALLAAVFGIIAACLLSALTPWLTAGLLKIPQNLVVETQYLFYFTAASLPAVFISSTLIGCFEAYQRFDIVNLIRAPSAIVGGLIPLVALHIGWKFPGISLLMFAKEWVFLFIVCCFLGKLLHGQGKYAFKLPVGLSLMRFGGWVAAQNLIVSVLLYFDRLIIGSKLSMEAVAYYSIPAELAGKAMLLPAAVMMVLFPAFSALHQDAGELNRLFARAWKYLVLMAGLVSIMIVIFARDLLLLWLGSDFAGNALVLQIFGLGIFFSALAWLCGTALQASGRPQAVALIHLAQIPAHLLVLFLLINKAGIAGAASAWSLRAFISLILLALACQRAKIDVLRAFAASGSMRWMGFSAAFVAAALTIKSFGQSTWAGCLFGILVTATMLFAVLWRLFLGQPEKLELSRLIIGIYKKRGLQAQ